MNKTYFLFLITFGLSLAHASDVHGDNRTIFCPATSTDEDGDGWGWENNTSCIVARAPANTPICDHSLLDQDDDGWGWQGGSSCLVDSTNEFLTPEEASSAFVGSFTLPFDESVKSFTATKSGIVIQQQFANSKLVARQPDGSVIWEVPYTTDGPGDFIEIDWLEENVIVGLFNGSIASFSIMGGQLNWWLDAPFPFLTDLLVGESGIIAHYVDPMGQEAVSSISYEGDVRWSFHTDRRITFITLAGDRVYLKKQKREDGSEITMIFNL